MRILDHNGNELPTYDTELGYVTEEELFVKHHDAIEAVEEKSHYEYGIRKNGVFIPGKRYPSGGQEAVRVIDVPGVEGKEAWDETETILRYTAYTPEEIEQRRKEREEAEKQRPEYRIAQLETELAETKEAMEQILSGEVIEDA